MKKEVGVLLAGGVVLLAVLSLISIKKVLAKKDKKYGNIYSDYHGHFVDDKNYDEEYHGVELYAVK